MAKLQKAKIHGDYRDVIRYYVGGKRLQHVIPKNTDVQSYYNDFCQALQESPKFNPDKIKLDDAIDLFLTRSEIETSPATVEAYRLILFRLSDAVQVTFITGITPLLIVKFQESIKHLSNHTINNHLNVIKTFFNWAIKMELLEKSPANSVKLLRTKSKAVHLLTKKDIDRIRTEVSRKWNDSIGNLVYLMSVYGLRWNEARSMRFSWIIPNPEICEGFRIQPYSITYRNKLYQFTHKTNHNRSPIPCTEEIRQLLQDQYNNRPTPDFPFVFWNKQYKQVSRDFNSYLNQLYKQLGYPISTHDLRHNAASRLVKKVESGQFSIVEFMAVFGWTDINTARNYLHQFGTVSSAVFDFD